jgi:hypothetical protein
VEATNGLENQGKNILQVCLSLCKLFRKKNGKKNHFASRIPVIFVKKKYFFNALDISLNLMGKILLMISLANYFEIL